MMLNTRMIDIDRVFLYPTFQRMWLYGQNRRVSIVAIEEILLFKVVGVMLHLGFEDGYYEHTPLVKSGELRLPNFQCIQLERMLIKGPIPTSDTITPQSFRLTFRR